jgi:hypothetical protein
MDAILLYLRRQGLFGDQFAVDAADLIERKLREARYSTILEGRLDRLVPPEDPRTSPRDPLMERNDRAARVAHEIVMLRERLKDAEAGLKEGEDGVTIHMVPLDMHGEVNPKLQVMGELAGKIASLMNGRKLSDIMNALCMVITMTAKHGNISKRVVLENTHDILSDMYEDLSFTDKKDMN